MNIVMEKLVQRKDGTIVVFKKFISYSTAEKLVASHRNGRDSTLAIFACVFAGCDHNRIMEDGRMVYESSFDSTNVYLEAQV